MPKFKVGDYVDHIPAIGRSLVSARRPLGAKVMDPNYNPNWPHDDRYRTGCTGCNGVMTNRGWGWEHDFVLLSSAVPVVPTAAKSAYGKLRIGDRVKYGLCTTEPDKDYGTVKQLLEPGSNNWLACTVCNPPCRHVVTDRSKSFMYECNLERIGSSQPALFAAIEEKPPTAKPKHPKLPCCGWCGEVIATALVDGKIVPACDAHGPLQPNQIVKTDVQNRRHP